MDAIHLIFLKRLKMKKHLILFMLLLGMQWFVVSCNKLEPSKMQQPRIEHKCCFDDGDDYPDLPEDEEDDNNNGGNSGSGD